MSHIQIENLKKDFLEFDEDNDGSLDKDELKNLLTNTLIDDAKITETNILELVNAADTNGDGLVTFEEFC